MTSQLAQKEENIRHMEERISVLLHRTEADCQALGQQLSTDERVRSRHRINRYKSEPRMMVLVVIGEWIYRRFNH